MNFVSPKQKALTVILCSPLLKSLKVKGLSPKMIHSMYIYIIITSTIPLGTIRSVHLLDRESEIFKFIRKNYVD